jgi:hypothetical protein
MRFSAEFRGLHVSAFSIRPLMRIPKSVSLVLAKPAPGNADAAFIAFAKTYVKNHPL